MASNRVFMDLLEEINGAIKDEERKIHNHSTSKEPTSQKDAYCDNKNSAQKEELFRNKEPKENIHNQSMADHMENMSNNAKYSQENLILKNIMNKVIRRWLNEEGKVITEEFFKIHIMRVLEDAHTLKNLFGPNFIDKMCAQLIEKHIASSKFTESINYTIHKLISQEAGKIITPIIEHKVNMFTTEFIKFIANKSHE